MGRRDSSLSFFGICTEHEHGSSLQSKILLPRQSLLLLGSHTSGLVIVLEDILSSMALEKVELIVENNSQVPS